MLSPPLPITILEVSTNKQLARVRAPHCLDSGRNHHSRLHDIPLHPHLPQAIIPKCLLRRPSLQPSLPHLLHPRRMSQLSASSYEVGLEYTGWLMWE